MMRAGRVIRLAWLDFCIVFVSLLCFYFCWHVLFALWEDIVVS